ncbi:hypothetical protein [Rhizobium sp. YTU87027]|uniref:hypothetical protein n=1 Tax=Rhizobium sp. YTU87027 TaxID=3417741 RepID=UPI003D682E52
MPILIESIDQRIPNTTTSFSEILLFSIRHQSRDSERNGSVTAIVVEMWRFLCHPAPMVDIRSPIYDVDDSRRALQCTSVFNDALSLLIRKAVLAGWREEEAALQIADLADDYILYLTSKPSRERRAANTNCCGARSGKL